MLTSIFTKTLHDQRRGLVGWGLGIAATVMVMGAIWPSFSDMDIDGLLAQYPEALRELFNVRSMSTGAGYLNAELFSLMLPAIFIVFAVGRGARLIAAEEEDGTLELLLTMPISRTAVLLQKAAGLVVELFVLTVVLLAATCATSSIFGLDVGVLAATNGALAMGLLGLEFGLIALALSAASGRRTFAVGVTSAIAGASYLVYLAAQLVESLRPLRNVSPFHQAISGGPIGDRFPPIVWLTITAGLVAFAASVRVFATRDLRV